MKELRIKLNRKEQVIKMAEELIAKFDIEGLEAEEVHVIKFFYDEKETLNTLDGQETD